MSRFFLQLVTGGLALFFFSVSAEELSVKCDLWELKFNSETGAWNLLCYKGKNLLSNSSGILPFELGFDQQSKPKKVERNVAFDAAELTDAALEDNGTGMKPKDGKFRLKKHHFDSMEKALTFFFTNGVWEVAETVIFHQDMLEIKARFGQFSSKDLKFRSFAFPIPLAVMGKYYFPGKFFTDEAWRMQNRANPPAPDFSKRMGSVRSLRPGRMMRSGRLIPVALFEQSPNCTVTVFMDTRTDGGSIQASRLGSTLKVNCRFSAQGWALSRRMQDLGSVWVKISERNAEASLKNDFPGFMKQLGFIRGDRPEWVYDAAIYSIPLSAAGTEEQNLFRTLAEASVPRAKQLGFNVLYIYPPQTGTGRYYPYDYMKAEPTFGTWEDYRKLIRNCHDSGLRLMQDTMPQGGTPHGAALRKDNLSEMCVLENGNILAFWAFDFNNPSWQKKMANAVEFYTRMGVDAYRVDAPQGGYRPNWRKAGFPAKKPYFENLSGTARFTLPAGFWERSLAEHGGVMPPLEYQRANQTLNLGGLNMVRAMREGMRKVQPEGALLLETDVHPFTAAGDLNYNSDIDSVQYKLASMRPELFVSILRTWLDEQQSLNAPDALFMQYVETGGRGDKMAASVNVGIEADKALRSLCWLIKGVPLLPEGAETGIAAHIQKLNHIRTASKELRRGDADYTSIRSSDRRIFPVLRTTKSGIAVGLINFSPKPVSTSITLPQSVLKRIDGKKAEEVFEGTVVKKTGRGTFALSMRPWQTAVLVWDPIRTGSKEKSGKTASVTGIPSLKDDSKNFTVTTAGYRLKISKTNALIDSFSQNGKLLCRGDMLQTGKEFPNQWRFHTSNNGNGVMIEASAESAAGKYSVTYQCAPEKVDMVLKLPRGTEGALTFHGAGEWQADCIEGLLHDFARPNGKNRLHFPTFGGSVGRDVTNDANLLWESSEHPLHPNSPEFRFGTSGQRGISVKFSGALPDHARLNTSCGNNDAELTLAFSAGEPERSIALSLIPGTEFRRAALPGQFQKNRLKLRCNGPDWTISNPHYVLSLNRKNGVIKELRIGKNGKFLPVLKLQDIDATAALKCSLPYATAGSDMESHATLTESKDGFRLKFTGKIRGLFNYSETPLYIETEYLFDSSPDILCEITIRSLFGASDPRLRWRVQLLPDGKGAIVLTPIIGNGNLPITIRQTGRSLFFDFFRKEDVILPQTQYHAGFVIGTAGKGKPVSRIAKKIPELRNISDGSFDLRGLRYSLRNLRPAAFTESKEYKSLYWQGRGTCNIRLDKDGNPVLAMPWPDPRYWQTMAPLELPKGVYRLRFRTFVEVNDIPDVRDWANVLRYWHTQMPWRKQNMLQVHLNAWKNDGSLFSVVKLVPVTRNAGWQQQSVVFEIPENARGPMIRLHAFPEYDETILLDDLELVKDSGNVPNNTEK